MGVIVNKVLPNKFNKINQLVRKGLERKGVRVLGVVPFLPKLSLPTIEQIYEETNFEILCGKEYLERYISSVIVGAMQPSDAIKYIKEDSLLITPGDREDMIMGGLSSYRTDDEKKLKISGIVLSGGIRPADSIMELLTKA